MPRKKKHPMHMTDDEALNHIFHPKIAKAVRKHIERENASLLKTRAKPQERQNQKSKSRKGV